MKVSKNDYAKNLYKLTKMNRIWLYSIVVIGILFTLINGCKEGGSINDSINNLDSNMLEVFLTF